MSTTIKVLRLACFTDIEMFKPKLVRSIEGGRGTKLIRRMSGNRRKLWLCFCTVCKKAYVLRSDYIHTRVCKCQRVKKAPAPDSDQGQGQQ